MKRKKKTEKVVPKLCKATPVRRTEWDHDCRSRDNGWSDSGGHFVLTASDDGTASLSVWGSVSYASANKLTEADLRCLAQQFLAAADQMTVWRCEP